MAREADEHGYPRTPPFGYPHDPPCEDCPTGLGEPHDPPASRGDRRDAGHS